MKILLLLPLALLFGCAVDGPAPVVERQSPQRIDVQPTRATEMVSHDTMQRVLYLFQEADAALADRRLTSPAGRSAHDYYRQILTLLPGNPEARQGLVNIVERYIQWSDAALRQGRQDRARLYLQRAAKVLPSYPPLAERREALERQPATREHYISLDGEQLRRQEPALARELAGIADRIRDHSARVIIEAPTDTLGRWIYQQLNTRHEGYRVRANMRLEAKPGLRLIY